MKLFTRPKVLSRREAAFVLPNGEKNGLCISCCVLDRDNLSDISRGAIPRKGFCSVTKYKRGVCGPVMINYIDNVPRSRYGLVNGLRHGPFRWMGRNIQGEGSYVEGRLDGDLTQVYTGRLTVVTNYRKGKRDGLARCYNSDGVLVKTKMWENGTVLWQN